MKNNFIKLFAIVFIFIALTAKTQEKHKIKIKIKGLKDTTISLAYYYGDKIKLEEKTTAKEPGVYIFKGDNIIPGGVYLIADQNKSKLFELVINKNQKFSLQTDTGNYFVNMKVINSKENKLFYEYLIFNESIYKSIKKLNDSLKNTDKNTDTYNSLFSDIDSLKNVLISYRKELIKNNPETFISVFLKATEEINIPDSIKNSKDKKLIFSYYKKHYWDNFDLSDPRLLRTPLYQQKIDKYINDLVVFNPDSVISAIDFLIEKAKPNNETVSYLVWHFTSEYQNPKYLGFDKVFVYMVDNYFKKMDIKHTTPSILQSLEDRANILKPLLLGKKAPNLILLDTSGSYFSFLNLKNDYTILLFWDYHCGVCKSEIKKLKEVLSANKKYDIVVYAINTNDNLEEWKKAIKEKGIENWINVNGTRSVTPDFHNIYDINRTPIIYLLDKDKKIIAKNLSAENIILFLDAYQK